MSEECGFCRGDFAHEIVKQYSNWEVQLFEDQKYLGRCLVKLERHVEDLNELTEEERNEFFDKVLPELENALDHLFQPDFYNQATLGNDCQHFHFHIIPRYRDERSFEGETFEDENWGQHYVTSKTKKLDDETMIELKREPEEALK
ncbi:HIT family protein [Candidatus Nanohalovita haloferacivicina]|uniref:HIT family protein n=1 Tax=Candidatus Nanohalovita haloferacivicina TaxID=2978046 RepID=UPI00325FBC7B|nr:HIT family hydrolase [Candidatus Nanohalobia archaeon BNXNv]